MIKCRGKYSNMKIKFNFMKKGLTMVNKRGKDYGKGFKDKKVKVKE